MSATFAERFQGKTVLITGHTGFKGSWLTLWLHRLGARVSGYALPPETVPSNFEASGIGGLLSHHIEADVRDCARLERAVADINPDVIFHLAAQPLVRRSYEQPRETFEVNLMGTVNLLDAMRRVGGERVCVVVTSDKCYENREQVWGYTEQDAMGGFDPYSASKGCVELAVSAMRRSFFPPDALSRHGVKIATARAGNVIGGGDWACDRIMTDVFDALAAGRPVEVRSPASVRPWQHVLEPLSGYLALAAAMQGSDASRWCNAWNFGPLPGTELSVEALVEKVVEAYGQGRWLAATSVDGPHEARQLRLSIDKAQVELGWRPRWSAAHAIERTAAWYRRFHDAAGAEARALCEADIDAWEQTPCPQ